MEEKDKKQKRVSVKKMMITTERQTATRPALSRRERQKKETRERIFRAAIELFAERGPQSVTIEQIAERADVGKGTFFNYFANKEAVLTYFGANQVERLEEVLENGEIVGAPRQCLQRLLHVLATHPNVTPELARGLFIASLSEANPSRLYGPSIWHIQDTLARIIRTGIKDGEFRKDHSAEELALFLLGQYFLGMLSWCCGFSAGPLPEVVDQYVELALDGISASNQGIPIGIPRFHS